MRYLTIFIIAIFWSFSVSAQQYEVGVYAGGSNFVGDVGSTTFIAPKGPVFGGIVKWNRSPRHSFRLTALFSQLKSEDIESDDPRRQDRGYEFTNSVKEVSLGLEYTFWEFNMFSGRNPSTPYLYTGLTYFNHDEFAVDVRRDALVKTGSSWDVAIPMVMGYKAALGRKAVIALEVGARYTLTDNLDGSAPDNNEGLTTTFGNNSNNDWYVFSGITLTFTFGRRPCFCAF
ncbi:MAG: DUF6089 family protein [Dokdonia sp.]|jgi:hypothetical protein